MEKYSKFSSHGEARCWFCSRTLYTGSTKPMGAVGYWKGWCAICAMSTRYKVPGGVTPEEYEAQAFFHFRLRAA